MSELRIDTWRMPVAPLGSENPLPPFDVPALQPVLSGKPEGDTEAGYIPDYLPYTMQDGYTRERAMTDVKVAVLENDTLRATFLLDYGGRLWSLVHKPSGRELLYVNPMLQNANLAMRNAWFSGGVEWNMGVIAHTPFNAAPLFAARLHTPDGTPVLRLYEFERIRQAAYQIDAYLPDASEMLYVRVRLVNPFERPLPMYWWSNIAVPEAEDVRVLVPAESSYRYALSVADLQIVNVPLVDGEDITYTTRFKRAADYFFLIPEERRPWITALDRSGKGLIQVSTGRLRGRKLFLWGTGQGGRRWQEWLSGPDHRYLEIQAGLAPTQLEYAVMPPHAEWSWLEAYGLMQADANTAHGADWAKAQSDIEQRLDSMAPQTAFDAEFARGEAWKDTPPDDILHRGSGWGALEALRRENVGESPFVGPGLDFSGALSKEQQPWVELLHTGRFPHTDIDTPAAGTLVQDDWRRLLENFVRENSAGWEAWLHLGTMRLHDGDAAGAREAWEQSLMLRRTPWALRNMAVLMRREGNQNAAADYLLEAHRLSPDLRPLWLETARALVSAERYHEFLDLLDTQPDALRHHGRVYLVEVEAALAVGDLERVGRLFDQGFEIVDYREGDEILTDLWFRYHAQRISRDEHLPVDEALMQRARREHPLPSVFDFRMKPESGIS
ncbi:MAG: DUF5107 domain-containing protein [Burkholderiales bacterium]|nr:DUF5107 domain-containing protein [Anaerolineae bacterium]